MTEPYVRRSDLPYTASQIFALFAEEKNVAFLDSSLENSLGQYAIIGLVPYHEVSVEKGRLFVDGSTTRGRPKPISRPILSAITKKIIPTCP